MNFAKLIKDKYSPNKDFSLSGYSCLKITGEDVDSFLHNQTTNNIHDLNGTNFQLNSVLSNKGLIESFFLLFKRDNYYFLLVDKDIFEQTLERLNKFLISEDVEIEAIEHSFIFTLIKPKISEFYQGNFLGENGFLFEGPSNNELRDFLNLTSILSGFPTWGIHIDKSVLFNNTTLVDLAYDPKKGCFPGNETISKVESRKGAGFKDVLLIYEGEADFKKGDALRINEKKVGTCTHIISLENTQYILCDLLRDYRINDYILNIDGFEKETFKVKLLPLYSTDNRALYAYDYAVELFQADNDVEALEYFKLAIDLDPTFSDAYESIAVLLGRLERFQEGVDYLNKLLEVDEKSVMAHTNLSMFHMKMGNIETAEEHKSLATIKNFERLGDEAEAKRAKEAAEEEEKAELIRREGMFKEVLELDEEDPLANYGLAEITFSRSQFDQSLDHIQKVLKSDPQYSVAYLLLGKIYLAQGEKLKAKEAFNKGIPVAAKKGDMMPANEMQKLVLEI